MAMVMITAKTAHVQHWLTAYVDGQLPRAKRERVLLHVQRCAECRAALYREEQLVRELRAQMPLVGTAQRGQLRRLFPAIWRDYRAPRPNTLQARKHFSPYSVVSALIIMAVFWLMALFNTPTYAIAAPFQAAPTQVRATPTLARTDSPQAQLTSSQSTQGRYTQQLRAGETVGATLVLAVNTPFESRVLPSAPVLPSASMLGHTDDYPNR